MKLLGRKLPVSLSPTLFDKLYCAPGPVGCPVSWPTPRSRQKTRCHATCPRGIGKMPLPLASRGGLCYDEEKPFSRREDLSMEFTYPQGLKKALTFSYDDGREFDRAVEIFNQHGLKGTFHLNSGTLGLHRQCRPRGGEGAVPGPRGGRPHREPPAPHVLAPATSAVSRESPRTARPGRRPGGHAHPWAPRRGGGRGQGPGDFVLPHHRGHRGVPPRTSSAGTPPATTAAGL